MVLFCFMIRFSCEDILEALQTRQNSSVRSSSEYGHTYFLLENLQYLISYIHIPPKTFNEVFNLIEANKLDEMNIGDL